MSTDPVADAKAAAKALLDAFGAAGELQRRSSPRPSLTELSDAYNRIQDAITAGNAAISALNASALVGTSAPNLLLSAAIQDAAVLNDKLWTKIRGQ